MGTGYKQFLAGKVFSDEEFVTYKALSRAQRVHSNQAKRMLYEFHRSENEKKPKSVHATYLLAGVSRHVKPLPLSRNHLKDGEDEVMQSSPVVGSQPAQPETTEAVAGPAITSILLGWIMLTSFKDAKSRFQKVLSIFVYSVQPTSLPDLNVLADIGQVSSTSPGDDVFQHNEKCGMIQNNNVKRRSGTPAAMPVPIKEENPIQKAMVKKAEQEPSGKKPITQSTDKKPEPSSTPFRTLGSSQSTAKSSQSKPTLKRDSSSIFKAFAKSKPKQQAKDDDADSTPNESHNTMLDDESEEEREDLFLDTGKKTSNKEQESRKDREERLRKMMEDEDMPDAPESPPEEEEAPEESDQASLASTPAPPQKQEPEPEPESSVSDKRPTGQRRRGRRQVMKKKVSRDAEGYLVTKEEPVWESFSEDEPEPQKRKPLPSSSAKSTKGGAKSSQGSIMSFFGRK
ncbi:hypothetical protein H109_02897 [Trichophyton interdigitale MR816]|uniref:DNA polymerase delta subunit 3 n=1 Tax=Trichophyton interdigitale (strain MR816) TaxID=1215338 RepID=A0A059JBL0_TRIIM|nr:hypothetical protein H101_02736 [Trichophyton interdigitale H6]KDB25266.1 hypothetical protein H109_02897 [Trichophyton interdigitale MR816]